MKDQFLSDAAGKKIAIVLPMSTYEKMLDELDEYACIKAYDKAKARKQEFMPAADMFKAIEQKRKDIKLPGVAHLFNSGSRAAKIKRR